VEVPETQYVERPDGVAIAYQVVGEGPRDLVYVPGFISHLDFLWTDPGFSRFLRRMAGFSRVILFDKPGTGLSDPIPHVPTLEERMADIEVVMDAAGSERAVLMGFSEGAPTCLLLAATNPARVEALVLYGGIYKGTPGPEDLEDFETTAEDVERTWGILDSVLADWGKGRVAEVFWPSANSPVDRRFVALFERASASPRMAKSLVEAVRRVDVRAIAPTVTTPALVLHRVGDFAPVGNSRWLARTMPNATLVEMPGADHAFWSGDSDMVVDEIEQFVTGARHSAEPDRVLSTVLFTDLVGSTQRAAELGDGAWRRRLEGHDALVRRQVAAFRGRVVKSMGDGHLAVFDGPARAIRCAHAICGQSEEPLRAGVHTGECEVIGDDVGGLAVHIGARVGALARTGEVLVSSTVKDLVVGAPLAFADRGEHELKGVPGTWRVYAVGPTDAPPPIDAERELAVGDRTALRLARHSPNTLRRVTMLGRRLGRSRA
jgi:class 3 adenylate cyclase